MLSDEKEQGSDEDAMKLYKDYADVRIVFLVSTVILLLFLTILSLTIGAAEIPMVDSILILIGKNDTSWVNNIIWNIRLPRVLSAIVAGAGLAVAGAAMQSVLRNPIGSPYTLGISHAAAFGAAFSVIVLGAGTTQSSATDAIILNNPYLVTISAFAWSLVSTFVIVMLSRYKKASPATMILTGVALGSLFTAGYTAMQYFASETELASIVFWTFGDVGRASWRDLIIMLIAVLASTIYFVYKSWDYEVLDSGDETAKSLGVDVEELRLHGMVFSCFVTALIVSFVGIIGFVGLVVPHMVRRVIGGNERFLIPSSFMVGSILLLVSDTVARTLIAPTVLPVGILTSFLGAPLFIYLVIKGREYW